MFSSATANKHVAVFDIVTAAGALIRSIGWKGSGDGLFAQPYDLAFSPDEAEFFVTDFNYHRVQVISIDGGGVTAQSRQEFPSPRLARLS